MNKYGYFKYSDYAIDAQGSVSYSINKELQEGSTLTQLSVGVAPYDYASFEENEYITKTPKIIYHGLEGLGLLTKEISDDNGVFANPVELTANFENYISVTGITINSRNIIKRINISAYRDNEEIISGDFEALSNEFFYALDMQFINKIILTIYEIDKPNHFFGIFNIQYGKTRILDETTNLDVKIINNFSVLGDTLEYDTLDLTIIKPTEEDYNFQRKQPIIFYENDEEKQKFYMDSSVDNNNNSYRVSAYDNISSLEDDFLGGIYKNYSFNTLINEIFAGTNIQFSTENTDGIKLNGYLPIMSRRKALQTVLLGSNIRCYKKEKLVFKPLETTLNTEEIDEEKIIEGIKRKKKPIIRSVNVAKHNYSKNKEEIEIYNWYISKTEDVQINFSQPIHSLKAYEVIGTDENDNDIVSDTESKNVTFLTKHINYCIVKNTSSNKIVIRGKGYTDSVFNYQKNNPLLLRNEVSEEKNIDLTIASEPEEVCNLLYDLYSREESFNFNTIANVEVGGYYKILDRYLNIKKKKNTLNGVYEVEAV